MSEQQTAIDKAEQREKLKKAVIIGLFVILFCVVVFFLLRPYIVKDEAPETGINGELPSATVESLPDSKLDSYSGQAVSIDDRKEIEEAQLENLYEYFDRVPEARNSRESEGLADQQQQLDEAVRAYNQATAMTNSYMANNPYASKPSYPESYNGDEIMSLEEELSAEQEKRESLEKELSMYKDAAAQEERQMKLLEKSYQLANQYNKPAEPQAPKEPEKKEGDRNLEAVSVQRKTRNVVSALGQMEKDTALLARMVDHPEEANMWFHTAIGKKTVPGFMRNTIKAVVSETQTVKAGDNVGLQLLEDMVLANGLVVPKHSRLIAKAEVNGNRMNLLVHSVEIGGVLSGLNLSAYDISGQEGIYIPDAPVSDAVRQFSSGVISTLSHGSQYSLNTDPKGQLVSDLIRGATTGVGNVLQNKVEEYKVTLKSGFRLFLYDRHRQDLNN